MILDTLPERGFGVLRAPTPAARALVLAYHAAGLIQAEHAGPGVFHARLTGLGRSYRRTVS